jgi:hypothetical protein
VTKTQQLAFALAYQNIANMDDEGIANYLELMGIKGTPDRVDECPLAEYFKWAVPNVVDINVRPPAIWISFSDELDLESDEDYEDAIARSTTSGISSFVERVDQNDFPMLNSRSPEEIED